MDAIKSSYFSPGEQEEVKGLRASVWQAEVALRLSKNGVCEPYLLEILDSVIVVFE